jgi:hypothetical protein
MIASAFWWDRDVDWNAIRRYATRCNGRSTCLVMLKSACWQGVLCLQVALTSSVCARWPVPTMSSPRWISSIRLCASLFWWPTRRRDGPDSRCWRRSASSPKNSLYKPARPMTRAVRTPDTSQVGRLTSWPYGTGRANGKPTNGSPSSWRTCAVHFGGPPITTTSRRPSQSRTSQGSSAFGWNSMNPLVGPRNSSIAHGPSTIGDFHSST